MTRFLLALSLTLFVLLPTRAQQDGEWTGTWATAPERIGQQDMPRHATLSGNSLRQIVQVSLGGESLRLWLTNEYSDGPVDIKAVYVADAAESFLISPKTARYLQFGGKRSVTLKAGEQLASDALAYPLRPLQRVAVTIVYGKRTPALATCHRGSRTTSYIIKGEAKPTAGRAPQVLERVEHWYNLAAIDVKDPAGRGAVAVLGNSLTDGRGSTTNGQDRWPDALARGLQQLDAPMGVLNLGIGGTCLHFGGAESGDRRLAHDVLSQRGLKKVIIFYGVNDLGGIRGDAEQRADSLIAALRSVARRCHEAHAEVYAATLTPFGLSAYDDRFREAARQTVNAWLRGEGSSCFDGVLDFDAQVREAADPARLQACYSADWLHLNPAGYMRLGRYAAERLTDTESLRSVVGQRFLIGAALNDQVVAGTDPALSRLVGQTFNAAVAENCMKGEVIHPEIDRYDWTLADRFMAYAKEHDMEVTGHCLVWHSQPPRWMFTDAQGQRVSRDELLRRMRDHIFAVVGRYKGQIRGWDVVNETFEDDGTMRRSPYYEIIGPDYIEQAFRFAHEADPDCELYINDYNMSKPAKRNAICRLVRELKAKGVRIDAIGMQSHNGRDYPDLQEWENTIDCIAATGCKAMVTEMDINMLPNPKGFGGAEVSQNFEYRKQMDPYADGLTAEADSVFRQRYLDIFTILHRHADQLTRVNLWGTDDGSSWLNDWPVKGRTNYPLFIGRDGRLKPVVTDIINLFKQ